MTADNTNQPTSHQARWFWSLMGLFVVLRLCIMATVGMIDDETYHWTWAKHIAWSYYDHPGMVAWIIWPFIQIFGDHAFVIRLPGFLMTLGIVAVVYQLGRDLFSLRVARLASLLIFAIPLWGFASLGTLPDLPLAFFWILMAWIFWQGVRPVQPWSTKKTWLWIGFVMGLGMNSKLTCCLIGLGMGLFLLFTPRLRKQLWSPWPYVAILITFAMMAPVFWWNAHHEWATFEYQFFRRHHEDLGFSFSRWLQFWSYQWIFMSPGVYLLMLIAAGRGLYVGALANFSQTTREAWRFIFCLPLPSLALFYYQPFWSAYKPHWSGPAYLILLFGACEIFVSHLWPSRWKKFWIGFCAFWLVLFGLLYIPLFTPVIPKIHRALNSDSSATWNPTWDFSNEFYGWIELGDHVKEMRDKIKSETGREPLFGAQRYELISQLTWGTKEKVWQMTRETDQFHFDQPAADKAQLIGRDFLIVNNDKYPRDPLEVSRFDSCEKSEFPFYRDGILSRTFYVYYCKNLH